MENSNVILSSEEIEEMIIKEIASVLKMDEDDIDSEENFMRLGIDSINALKIINALKHKLKIGISPIALFEYKNVSEFAEYLEEGGDGEYDGEDEVL